MFYFICEKRLMEITRFSSAIFLDDIDMITRELL